MIHPESDYDVVLGFVAFSGAEEVLWLDNNSVFWFPYSWDTAGVSSVSSSNPATNEGTIICACRSAEKHAGIRALVRAGSNLLSVTRAQHKLTERCPGVSVP